MNSELGPLKLEFHNEVVKNKNYLIQAKTQTIHKLSKKAKQLKSRKGTDEEKAKFNNKAESIVKEILLIKKITHLQIGKFAMKNFGNLMKIMDTPIVTEEKVMAKLLSHKSLKPKFQQIIDKFSHVPTDKLLEVNPIKMRRKKRKEKLKLLEKKAALLKDNTESKACEADDEVAGISQSPSKKNKKKIKVKVSDDEAITDEENERPSNEDNANNSNESLENHSITDEVNEISNEEDDETSDEVDDEISAEDDDNAQSVENSCNEHEDNDSSDDGSDVKSEDEIVHFKPKSKQFSKTSDEIHFKKSVIDAPSKPEQKDRRIFVDLVDENSCNEHEDNNSSDDGSDVKSEDEIVHFKPKSKPFPKKSDDVHFEKSVIDASSKHKPKDRRMFVDLEDDEIDLVQTEKTVDSFFMTDSGDNYMTVALPRPPDIKPGSYVDEKAGNRRLRRAAMFGNDPAPRHKNLSQNTNKFSNNPGYQNNEKRKYDNSTAENVHGRNTNLNQNKSNNQKFNAPDNFRGQPARVEEKLHPSWEAKKKKPAIAAFAGTKVKFDD